MDKKLTKLEFILLHIQQDLDELINQIKEDCAKCKCGNKLHTTCRECRNEESMKNAFSNKR